MSYEADIAHVRGNPDDFGDWNELDRIRLSQGLISCVKGDNNHARELFNSRFNDCISYHASLWRNVPHSERDFAYYCYRYSRLFEDLYRLCEEFPNLPVGNEYNKFIALHKHYIDAAKAFEDRKEMRRKQEAEAHIQAYREEKEAFYTAHPELRKPQKCPRCGARAFHIDYFSGFPPYCSACNLGRF